MPKVNYAAANQDFSPVDAGVYNARLAKTELKQGPKGPYYNCEYTLEGSNKKVWQVLSLSDEALWRFKQVMIVLGADPQDLAPESEVDTDDIVAEVLAAPCRLQLIVETYTDKNGEEKSKNTITNVLSPIPF